MMCVKENIFLSGFYMTHTMNWVHKHVSEGILISSVSSPFWDVLGILFSASSLVWFPIWKDNVF